MTAPAEFLARILDDAPQPVWVVDEDAIIVFTTPAAVASRGYDDAAELRRRPSHETVHYKRPDGSPYPVADCPMLTPRQTGATVHGDDEWFVRRDGSLFPIAWWSAPIAMAEGNGAVLAFTDITERRCASGTPPRSGPRSRERRSAVSSRTRPPCVGRWPGTCTTAPSSG